MRLNSRKAIEATAPASIEHLLLYLFAFLFVFGASAQKIRIKVIGQKDTTVQLIKYFGKGLYYADTAKIIKGEVVFDGAKQKPGILGLLLPGQQYFEFIYNKEEISLETSGSNGGEYTKNLVVKKSEENKQTATVTNNKVTDVKNNVESNDSNPYSMSYLESLQKSLTIDQTVADHSEKLDKEINGGGSSTIATTSGVEGLVYKAIFQGQKQKGNEFVMKKVNLRAIKSGKGITKSELNLTPNEILTLFYSNQSFKKPSLKPSSISFKLAESKYNSIVVKFTRSKKQKF